MILVFIILLFCSGPIAPYALTGRRLRKSGFSTLYESVDIDQESKVESFKAPLQEIERRRNFAIISHPDAGKTTLTEKLLLFGGAIQDAGAVKARADQRKVWLFLVLASAASMILRVLSITYMRSFL